MEAQTNFYFLGLILSFLLNGFLSWYAWRNPPKPGVRAFAIVALNLSLLSLATILSMVSVKQEQARFWFNVRFTFLAFIPILFLIFSISYYGYRAWLSRTIVYLLCIIPAITQVIIWTNSFHHLWVIQDAFFSRIGNFWIIETSMRIPGFWFIVHTIYGLLTALVGIVILLIRAWKIRRELLGQSILVTLGAVFYVAATIVQIYNLLPAIRHNVYVPLAGISSILFALAVLQFSFLKETPVDKWVELANEASSRPKKTSALFLGIFILMATGIISISTYSFRTYADNFQKQVTSQLKDVAGLKISGLSGWRAERQNDALMITQNPLFTSLIGEYIENPDDIEIFSEIQSLLRDYETSFGLHKVFLVGKNGNPGISSSDAPVQIDNLIHDQIIQVFNYPKVTWIDFYQDHTGISHLYLVSPVFLKQESTLPVALLVLDINPETWLYPYLRLWTSVSDTGETFLVRKDGQDALVLNPLRFNDNAAFNLRTPLTETKKINTMAVLGATGAVEGLDYRNSPVFSAIYPIPGTPWILVAQMSQSEIKDLLRERQFQSLISWGGLLIASGSILWLIWRRDQMNAYRETIRALDALRESEEKFRKAFLISPDAVIIVQYDSGQIISVNKGFEEIMGFSKDEAVGKKPSDLNLWVDLKDKERFYSEMDDKGIVRSFEVNFRTKDGKIRKGLLAASTVDINGKKHFLNTTRDVTEITRTFEALRESEERYRNLLELAPIGLLVYQDGLIKYSNPAFAQLVGADFPEQIVGFKVENLVHSKNINEITDQVQRLLSGLANKVLIEEVMLKVDGSKVNVQILATPMVYEGKHAIQVIINDITDIKKAQQAIQEYSTKLEEMVALRTHELQEAQGKLILQERLAAIGQVAGSIAHELRNPLGVISNAAMYLTMIQPDAAPKIREYLKIIQDETHISEKIITNLLNFTRLQSGERKPESLSRILQNALIRFPAPESIQIQTKIPKDLPEIFVDAAQMEQVFGNIFTNAYQAMPESGELRIDVEIDDKCEQPGSRIKVDIKDTGDGISPENLFKIFDPLFSTKVKGIGLGLPICCKFVEANSGQIDVQSEIGKGSVFTIMLPVYREAR